MIVPFCLIFLLVPHLFTVMEELHDVSA